MSRVEVFPLAPPSIPELRRWIDDAIQRAWQRGQEPVWALPEPSLLTPEALRLRRAALLFILALPGSVQLDVEAERALQSDHVSAPYDVDSILDHAASKTHRLVWRAVPPGTGVSWHENAGKGMDGVIAFECKFSRGALTQANFGEEPCHVTDGSIDLASDNPYGLLDPFSDSDRLPPLTTIWLARK